MLNLIIDLVPYDLKLKKVPNTNPNIIGDGYYTMDNPFGLDGLEALKRANPYGDPCGYVGMIMVTVESEDELTLHVLSDKHLEENIEDVMRHILNAYDSVGWECLEQDGEL